MASLVWNCWCGYCGKMQEPKGLEEYLAHLDYCETELTMKMKMERESQSGVD